MTKHPSETDTAVLRPHTLDEVESLLADVRAARVSLSDESERKRLEVVCHPDKNPTETERATKLFQRLQEIATKPPTPSTRVKSPRQTYELGEILAVGDVADIYEAKSIDKSYILKLSRVSGSASVLETEKTALTKILAAAGDSIYRLNFPVLAESFLAGSRRANVFTPLEDVYSLDQLMLKFPDGLPGEHMVWIGKKLLTAIGFAHLQKIVHGAIVPSHILVQPKMHMIVVCGWGQSVTLGQPLKSIAAKYKDFYPPEVFAKKPATRETDVYMAAKCLEQLQGRQDWPKGLHNPLRACLMDRQAMRPGDAWGVHDDLADMAGRIYGAPKFVPMTV